VQGGRVWRRHVDHLLESHLITTDVPQDDFQQGPNLDNEWSSMPGNSSSESVDSSSNGCSDGNAAEASTQNEEVSDTSQPLDHIPGPTNRSTANSLSDHEVPL